MKNNLDKEALKAYFKDTVEKFEQYFNDPESLYGNGRKIGMKKFIYTYEKNLLIKLAKY